MTFMSSSFVTITRVTKLLEDKGTWPAANLTIAKAKRLSGMVEADLISRLEILVAGPPPSDIGIDLKALGFRDTAGSMVDGGGALVCSDFGVGNNNSSRAILFNNNLNA